MRSLILLPCAMFLSYGSIAQVLGNWTLDGTLAGTGGAYNTVSPVAFSAAIGPRGFSGTVYYGENGWPAGTLDPASYLEFSLTPTTGYALNILSVRLGLRRSTTGSPSGSGPVNWSIRSSVDGFTTNLGGGSLTTAITTTTITPPAGFDRLAAVVTFRVYGFQASVTSGGLNRFVFEDIQVQGSNIVLATRQTALSLRHTAGKVHVSGYLAPVQQTETFAVERSETGIEFIPVHQEEITSNTSMWRFAHDDIFQATSRHQAYYRLSIYAAGMLVYRSAVKTIEVGAGDFRGGVRLRYYAGKLVIDTDKLRSLNIQLFDAGGRRLLHTMQRVSSRAEIVLPKLRPALYFAIAADAGARKTIAVAIQ